MDMAVIGLGRVGGRVAKRLLRGGHKIVAYDIDGTSVSAVAEENAVPAGSLDDVMAKLLAPRVIWIALPTGEITESAIARIIELASPGDVIVDCSETFYEDDIRRDEICRARSLHYIDVGATWSALDQDSDLFLMVGGEASIIRELAPILEILSTHAGALTRGRGRRFENERPGKSGYIHAGPAGSGHFVRMVHGGIKSSIAEAYWEGFNILQRKANAPTSQVRPLPLNLKEIKRIWDKNCLTSSDGLDLLLAVDALGRHKGSAVNDCRRTVEAALELASPAPVISAALASQTQPGLIE